MTTKDQVLKVLRDTNSAPHEAFNKLMELLRQTPQANAVTLRTYNQAGVNKETIARISYDLQQYHGIKDVELRPGYIDTKVNIDAKADKAPVSFTNELLSFDAEGVNYHKELKPFAIQLAESLDVELKDSKKSTLVAFVNEQKEILLKKNETKDVAFVNPFTEASPEAKQGLKLRDEFPFLGDPKTPAKLKALVADKLTAFYAVLDARAELFAGEAPIEERALELCKEAIENFELNQLIYDELNHYKEHNEILGKHPVFADEMLQREVDQLSDNKAHKAITTTQTYISKERKKLTEAKTPESKETIEAVIAGHETKIALLKKKLGIEK